MAYILERVAFIVVLLTECLGIEFCNSTICQNGKCMPHLDPNICYCDNGYTAESCMDVTPVINDEMTLNGPNYPYLYFALSDPLFAFDVHALDDLIVKIDVVNLDMAPSIDCVLGDGIRVSNDVNDPPFAILSNCSGHDPEPVYSNGSDVYLSINLTDSMMFEQEMQGFQMEISFAPISEAIDECASNPCLNGLCIDGLYNFTCQCYHGYEGVHCETGCSIPCHYGTCVTSVNGTADYCKCTTGYQGDTCQWGSLIVLNDSPKIVSTENVTVVTILRVSAVDFLDIEIVLSEEISIATTVLPSELSQDLVPDWVILSELDLPQMTDDNAWFVYVLEYNFTEVGMFSVSINIHNLDLVVPLESLSDIFIQQKPCMIPDVSISGGGLLRNESLKIYRSQTLNLFGNTGSMCTAVNNVIFRWTAYLMTEEDAIATDASRVQLSTTQGVTHRDLVVRKQTLEYGIYMFKLKATVPTTESSISNTGHTWVQVVTSDLQPVISGGTVKTIDLQTTVTLDGSTSTDPDQSGSGVEHSISYTWFCVQADSVQYLPTNLSVEADDGGSTCFEGSDLELSDTSAKITFPASDLLIDSVPASFVIRLFISKDGRPATYVDQHLEMVAGDPPDIELFCFLNCDKLVNPSEKLVLKTICSDCSDDEELSYTWDLRPANESEVQTLDWERNTTTGRHGYNLVLRGGVFSVDRMDAYEVTVIVERQDGTTSTATYSFTTNAAPTLGSCFIEPTEGALLQTRFNISCEGFTDTDSQLVYQVWAGSGGTEGGTGKMIHYGYDSAVTGLRLPKGDPGSGYNLTVTVAVGDTFGAFTKVSHTVVVQEAQNITITDLKTMTSGTDSELEQIIYSGDTQAATQLISSVAAFLQQGAEDGTAQGGTAQGGSTADGTAGEGDMPGDVVEGGTSYDGMDGQTDLIELQETLVTSFSKVEVQTIESLQATSFALSEITTRADIMTNNAQNVAAAKAEEMAAILTEKSEEGSNTVDVESSGLLLIGGLANIMKAVTLEQNITLDVGTSGNGITEGGGTEDGTADGHIEIVTDTQNASKSIVSAISDIRATLLSTKVPGESPTEIVTDTFTVELSKAKPRDVLGQTQQITVDNQTEAKAAYLSFPASLKAADGVEELGTEITQYHTNPYTWSSDDEIAANTAVIDIALSSDNNQSLSTLDDEDEPISIMLPIPDDVNTKEESNMFIRKRFVATAEMTVSSNYSGVFSFVAGKWLNVTEIDDENEVIEDADRDNVESEAGLLFQVIHMNDVSPVSPEVARRKRRSTVMQMEVASDNVTVNGTLLHETVIYFSDMPDPDSSDDRWTKQLLPAELVGPGDYLIQMYTVNTSLAVNVSLVTTETSCVVWNKKREVWEEQSCMLGQGTSSHHLHCRCRSLGTLAGRIFVMPNTLNFREDLKMFLTFWQNPVGVALVAFIFVLYVLAVVWARKKDRQYESKALPIDLIDNNPSDRYLYMLTVFTGTRRGAGTTSNITATILGEDGSSDPHLLECSGFPILQRGDVNFFLIRTPQCLGELTAIRLWHHSIGSDPSWYVSRAVVCDLQTTQEYNFMCESWLGVDIGEGRLDLTFPVATEVDLKDFQRLFMFYTASGFKDRHLWFSALNRPVYSPFTCVQRVSVCLSLFMSCMLCNIMFWGKGPEATEDTMNLGPVSLTWTSLKIGFQTTLVMFPLNFMIMNLFRNTARRNKVSELWWNDTDLLENAKDLTETFESPATPPEQPEPSSEAEPSSSKDSMSTISLASSTRKATSSTSQIQMVLEQASDEILQEEALAKKPSILSRIIESTHSFFDADSSFDSLEDIQSDIAVRTSMLRKILMKNCSKRTFDSSLSGSEFFHSAEHISMYRIPESTSNVNERNDDGGYHGNKDGDGEQLPGSDFVNTENIHIHVLPDEPASPQPPPDASSSSPPPPARGCCPLPWWCLYIGWVMVGIVSLTCGFFTILYTFNFGLHKSIRWSVSLITSWTSDMFMTQPFKVVIMSVVVTMMNRRPQPVNHIDTIAVSKKVNEKADLDGSIMSGIQAWLRQDPCYQPPGETLVKSAREHEAHKQRMSRVFIQILRHGVFLYLVMLIVYSQRDANLYLQNKAIADIVINDGSFDEIQTYDDLYEWLNTTLMDAVYDQVNPEFLSNSVSYKLASPRLRQVRINKVRNCEYQPRSAILECHWKYSRSSEDRTDYNETWSGDVNDAVEYPEVWLYQSEEALGGRPITGDFATYSGGGYSADLGSSPGEAMAMISYLFHSGWLDSNTVAVFVDISAYSPNVNMVSTLNLLLEVSPVGGLWKSSRLYSMQMYRVVTSIQHFIIVIEILYCLYTLYFTYYEVRRMLKLKKDYFCQPWNYLEVATIVTSYAIVVIYTCHTILMKRALKDVAVKANKHHLFFNAQIMDQAMIHLFSVLVTIAMVKFLHLLRFNPVIFRFESVLQRLVSPLLAFCLMFSVFILAFATLMFGLTGSKIAGFQSLMIAAQTLFMVTLGEFEKDGLREFDPFWGPFIFTIYICFIIFIFMNLLCKLLFEALRDVKLQGLLCDDTETVHVMIQRFRQMLGLRNKSVQKISAQTFKGRRPTLRYEHLRRH